MLKHKISFNAIFPVVVISLTVFLYAYSSFTVIVSIDKKITVEEVYAWAKINGISIKNEDFAKRLATSNINSEWHFYLKGLKKEAKKRDQEWYITQSVLVLKLRMGGNGEKIYKEIHDILLSEKLLKNQQIAIINMLADEGDFKAANTLTNIILDGFDYKANFDLEQAIYHAIASFGVRASTWHFAGKEYVPGVTVPLGRLLVAKRDDQKLYATTAYSIGSIGTVSGVNLLLHELISNKFFADRVMITRDAELIVRKNGLEKITEENRDLSISTIMPGINIPILEIALSHVSNPEGIQVLIDNLNEGAPTDTLTIASGRALARMQSSQIQDKIANEAIIQWSSQLTDHVQLASELFGIISSQQGQGVILGQLVDKPFKSEKVKSVVVQIVKNQLDRKTRVQDAYPGPLLDFCLNGEGSEKTTALEISMRVKNFEGDRANSKQKSVLRVDNFTRDGKHWRHSNLPQNKGMYIEFNGSCLGCTVLYPRKYQFAAAYLINDPGTDRWYIPQEGTLEFYVPDTILQPISITLVDPPGNGVSIETDEGSGIDTAEGRRTKFVNVKKQKAHTTKALQFSAQFFIMKDSD